jgi:hypothetical protein
VLSGIHYLKLKQLCIFERIEMQEEYLSKLLFS